MSSKRGFTLIELLVVLAILVALTALLVPKLSGMTEQGNLATSASNISDTSRMIQTFEAQYGHAPAHMATLRSGADGTGPLITTLHPGLAPFVQAATLTPVQLKSLVDAGIGHVHSHNMPAGTAPSETDGNGDVFFAPPSFNPAPVTSAPATILIKEDVGNFNPSTWTASTIMRSRGLGVSPFMPRYANTLVVFGVGNISELKGKVMQDAPLFLGAVPEKYYARAIAVYEIPDAAAATGFKARFVGVIAPDGTYLAQNLSDYTSLKNQ